MGPLLWWNSRAEALGIKRARIAGPILPGVSKWFSSLAAESFPQRRTGPIKEALHPRTPSAGIVILADGLIQILLNDNGQDLIEYALVVALIAFAATVGMNSLATKINLAFAAIGSTLTTYVS